MAYFDSAKNRALWKIELEELKAKREARDREAQSPDGERRAAVKKQESPVRRSITFEQLLEEEALAVRGKRMKSPEAGRVREAPSKAVSPERTAQRQEPVKTAKGLGR